MVFELTWPIVIRVVLFNGVLRLGFLRLTGLFQNCLFIYLSVSSCTLLK